MEEHHTRSNPERISVVIKSWEVQLLAEGGYNYVWLVTYTATHHVSNTGFLSKHYVHHSLEEPYPKKVVFKEITLQKNLSSEGDHTLRNPYSIH